MLEKEGDANIDSSCMLGRSPPPPNRSEERADVKEVSEEAPLALRGERGERKEREGAEVETDERCGKEEEEEEAMLTIGGGDEEDASAIDCRWCQETACESS